MPATLSESLRQAARTAPSPRATSDEVRRRLGERGVPTQERDRLLWELIQLYRSDKQTWAPALLDAVAPALITRLRRFRSPSPIADGEDLAQQMVLEVLRAAASMPLPEGARFVEQRLILHAAKPLSRWLQRESKRIANQVFIDEP